MQSPMQIFSVKVGAVFVGAFIFLVASVMYLKSEFVDELQGGPQFWSAVEGKVA